MLLRFPPITLLGTLAQKPPIIWLAPVRLLVVIGVVQSEASPGVTSAHVVFAIAVCVAQNPCVRVPMLLSYVQLTVPPAETVNVQVSRAPSPFVSEPEPASHEEAMSF